MIAVILAPCPVPVLVDSADIRLVKIINDHSIEKVAKTGRHFEDAEEVREAADIETGASIDHATDCGESAAPAARYLCGLSGQLESLAQQTAA
jgi:hypothetical protein